MTTENQSGFNKDQLRKALLDPDGRTQLAGEFANEGINALEAAHNLGHTEIWDMLCKRFHKEISAALKKTQATTEPLFISITDPDITAHRETNGWVEEHIKTGGSYIDILNKKHPKYIAMKAKYERKEKEATEKSDVSDQPKSNPQQAAAPYLTGGK